MAGHYFNTIENNVTGKPVAAATVAVLTAPSGSGGSAVAIFSDDGVTPITSSIVTTDSFGFFEFWTNITSVTLEISYGGTIQKTITDVEILGGSVSGDVTALAIRMDAAELVTQDTMVVALAALTPPGAITFIRINADNSLSALASAAFNTAIGLGTGDSPQFTAINLGHATDTTLTRTAAGQIAVEGNAVYHAGNNPTESIIVACSDETTSITTGTAKVTMRMPYAFTLTAVRASVGTAPTGSTIIIDINESGATILSTKLSIDASEKTSTTAASAAVISDTALADDAEITFDFDQVGSTIAGAGVKVYLIGRRT